MAIFDYRARDSTGRIQTGRIDAAEERDAVMQLQRLKLTVISLGISRDIGTMVKSSKKDLGPSLFKVKVTSRDLASMTRQLGMLYSSGINIADALRTIHQQTANPTLKALLQNVATRVREGEGLGESLRRYPHVFPPLLYNMVSAGEVSGSLDEVLDRAALHFERDNEIEEKVKSALFYPKMVLTAMGAVSVFILAFVVPRFTELFLGLGVALPLPTRILMAMGNFMGSYWWAVAVGAFALYAFTLWYGKTADGHRRFDDWSLRYPVFGKLNSKKIVARFCRTLGTLSRSGVPIVPAMALVRQVVGNIVVEEALLPAQEAIRRGEAIAPQLAKCAIFPPMVIQMITVGEETGGLETMLERAAGFMEDEVKHISERMTQMIEPYVIILLGFGVTFVVLSVVLPMFDSFGAIG